MFAMVAIFGLATIVFAPSRSFPLVQIVTRDTVGGRVSAINYPFLGSSNTLGEFKSGTVAAWLGAVPSVLIDGIGSLMVALIWMVLFPGLRKIDRSESADERNIKT